MSPQICWQLSRLSSGGSAISVVAAILPRPVHALRHPGHAGAVLFDVADYVSLVLSSR